MDLAIVRLVLSLAFGIGIGLIMAFIFRGEGAQHNEETNAMFSGQGSMQPEAISSLVLLVGLLVVSTLQIDLLKQAYFQLELPLVRISRFQNFLYELAPFDPARGEEGVTAQGAVLIGLLVLIGLAAWKGIESIFESFSVWTWILVGLFGLTLLFASLDVVPQPSGVSLRFTGKFFGIMTLTIFWAGCSRCSCLKMKREISFGNRDVL